MILAAPLAHTASFGCSKSSSFAEKSVCTTSLLDKLDDALAINCKSIAASNIGSGALKDLKSTPKAWLAVSEECRSKSWIIDANLKRIDALYESPVITGAHPSCASVQEVGYLMSRLAHDIQFFSRK